MIEREVKLAVEDGFDIVDPEALVDTWTVMSDRVTDVTAIYLDTVDLRLLRWGASLRHRSPEGWTVKLPVGPVPGMMVRAEHAFGGTVALGPPQAALDLVAALVRTAPLVPVARLTTRRRAIMLADADGRAMAEVTVDRVSGDRIVADPGRASRGKAHGDTPRHAAAEAFDPEAIEAGTLDAEGSVPESIDVALIDSMASERGARGALAGPDPAPDPDLDPGAGSAGAEEWEAFEPFTEVEVEVARHVRAEDARPVVKALRRRGAGKRVRRSKVVRAVGDRACDPPDLDFVRLGRSADVATLVRSRVATHVRWMVEHDPHVRLGRDPEAVHQMRVASRRLRSDLRALRPLLDREWADSLRDELAWLGDALGPVRDADVLGQLLIDRAAGVAQLDKAVLVRLLAVLTDERDSQRTDLLLALRSDRYIALLDRLVAAVDSPGLAPDVGKARASKAVARLTARSYRRLRRAVRKLSAEPAEDELHEVRILTKRARYAADTLADVSPGKAERLARRLGGLQAVLGDRHDLVVASAWLRSHAGNDPAFAFAAGELSGLLAAELHETASDWRPRWRAVERVAS